MHPSSAVMHRHPFSPVRVANPCRPEKRVGTVVDRLLRWRFGGILAEPSGYQCLPRCDE
jgi:hypothetical protein